MNKMALIELLKKKAEESDVTYEALQLSYFFEAFLKRLEKSRFKYKLYLKGGLLLSLMLSIENRRTTDIDFLLRNERLDEENIETIVKEIIAIPVDDMVSFKFINTKKIKEKDIYGGVKVSLFGKLENIKQFLSIDFTTGDPISGDSIDYEYQPLVGEPIKIRSYNLETILAEKIHTIFVKGLTNTRSKDFFDVYIIEKLKRNEVHEDILKKALAETFKHRSSIYDKKAIIDMLKQIAESSLMIERWQNYINKNPYANSVKFEETLKCVESFL